MTKLSEVRIDRLTKLADYLDTVPPEQFNIGVWQDKDYKECGFAGCAVGWAINAKLFDGFEFGRSLFHRSTVPTYERRSDWEAVARLFKLRPPSRRGAPADGLAIWLFHHKSYLRGYKHLLVSEIKTITPAMVAARIRKLVQKIESRLEYQRQLNAPLRINVKVHHADPDAAEMLL
jgi:hypothetical protein